MGLASSFQKELKRELNFHAAWLPVANNFKVGTYGLVEGGVMRPIGHISDLGVLVGSTETSPSTPAAFQSKGVITLRMVANVEVDAFPEAGNLDAKLKFVFKDQDSVLFKAATIELESMTNIEKVGKELAHKDEWQHRFRVVSGIYRAKSPVVLLASEANTTISFDAKVSALKQIEGGKGDVKFSLSASSEKSFRSVGKPGVVGLALFKLGWFGGLKLLGPEGNVRIDDGASWNELENDL